VGRVVDVVVGGIVVVEIAARVGLVVEVVVVVVLTGVVVTGVVVVVVGA